MSQAPRESGSPIVVLCLTYLFYFGQLGVLTPYLGVFLDGRGFSSADIGTLFALITLTRIIGPSLWAGLADKRGNPLKIMQLGCLITALIFVGVFFVQGFIGLTLVFALMMMFWTAVLPQLEVITLHSLSASTFTYGKVRLWGSVGFIALTVITGQFIDQFGSESPIYVSMFALTALFLSTLFITGVKQNSPPAKNTSRTQLLLRRPFVVFLLASTLLQISFGAFYGFFALYLRDLGYDGVQTGLFIALGVLAEVGIFLVASQIIGRFGVRNTLFVSLFLTAIRWWILGFHGSLIGVVIVAQLIHALSFGLTHATSVHFIHQFFPPQFQSRGQAIYISVAFGIGGATGHFISGLLWQNGEGATETFALAGALSILGAALLLLTTKNSMDKPRLNP